MPYEEYIFGDPLTIDRSSPPGANPMPVDLRGIVPEAPGVMRARGQLDEVVGPTATGFQLFSYDDTGIATFVTVDGSDRITHVHVLKDETFTSMEVFYTLPETRPPLAGAYNIPGAGIVGYKGTQEWLLYDRDGVLHQGPDEYTYAGTAAKVAASGGDMDGKTWDVLIIAFLSTRFGKYAYKYEFSGPFTLGAGEGIKFTADTHAFGDNLQIDCYIKESDTANNYVLAATLKSAETETVKFIPVGRELDAGDTNQRTALLDVPFEGQTVMYRGRVWGKASTQVEMIQVEPTNTDISLSARWGIDNWPNMRRALSYSTFDYLNLALPTNFVADMNVPGSREITGLIPTEAGIFTFGENGAALLYGDPTLAGQGRIENFGQRAIDRGLGHDDTQAPALLSGTPYHIWRGRIYTIDGSASQEVAAHLYDEDDPFTALAPDNKNKLLLALTQGGNIFVYDAIQRIWLGDSASDGIYDRDDITLTRANATLREVDFLIPNATHGALYGHYDGGGGSGDETFFNAYVQTGYEDMKFEFDTFSLGDRFRRDEWVSLEVFIENPASTPTITYDTESGGSATLGAVSGRQRDDGDLYDFVFPWGLACRTGDFTLIVPADGTTRVHLPWRMKYVPREDSQWGKDSLP